MTKEMKEIQMVDEALVSDADVPRLLVSVDYFTKENPQYREYDYTRMNLFYNPFIDDMDSRLMHGASLIDSL